MKILLATDGSDCARAAMDFLVGFPFPGDSSITLLAVIDDRTLEIFTRKATMTNSTGPCRKPGRCCGKTLKNCLPASCSA